MAAPNRPRQMKSLRELPGFHARKMALNSACVNGPSHMSEPLLNKSQNSSIVTDHALSLNNAFGSGYEPWKRSGFSAK